MAQANGIAIPPPNFPADILTKLQPGPPTNGPKHIWYAAHVQNHGWQTPTLDGGFAGTSGQSLRLEALALLVVGCQGIAAVAYVQNLGWQSWGTAVDAGDFLIIGTTGRSLRMEALSLLVGNGQICANVFLQDIKLQGELCDNQVTVGTTGQSRRIEGITLTVR